MKEQKEYRNPPRIAEWILKKIYWEKAYSIRLGDFGEIYNEVIQERNILTGWLWYWDQIFISVIFRIKFKAFWSITMFTNYLKIAVRNFKRYKLFSFINVFGLAIGIATCMIISFWVQRELSYDRFHKNAHRIYRLERELFRDNLYSRWPIVSGAYKQALIDDYPEIENSVRFWRREFSIKDSNEIIRRQTLYAVDNSVFEIFDFGLEKGDHKTALTEPMSVVLSRENALKYLGTVDVIGKSLTFEWNGEPVDFQVTGILNKVPENSHVHFDMLISISSYPENRFNDWRSNYLYTYILVSENTMKSELENKLKTFVNQHLEPVYGDLLSQGLDIHEVLKLELVPVIDIHLNPSPTWEIEPQGSMLSVYIFSSVAFLILLIACINFINLSTARANKRAKEVGLRKTIGAGKNQLIGQFIQESVILAVITLPLAVAMLSLFFPVYNYAFGEELSVYLLLQAKNLLIFTGITLAVGLFAGLYPAFYLTRFEPVIVLKGGVSKGTGKSAFRKNMVIIQFLISITLIIGMFTVYKQMKYIQNRNLGFNKENVVVLTIRSRQVAQGFNAYRSELLQDSNIKSVSASSDIPSVLHFSNTNFGNIRKPEDPVILTIIFTDYDFVDTYKMNIRSGRKFSKDFSTDTSGTILLNEAAVTKFGWTPEEAVGKELRSYFGSGRIIGVVKNFHLRSLRDEIEPTTLLLFPNNVSYISIRILPGDVVNTLNYIRQKWDHTFPGEQFEYSFLDNRINRLYENEKKMQNIFIVFTCFSIFVACLGLFGLAAYTSEARTKEIGIRKVMGATSGNVVYLLSKEITGLVILANIVAWPLAWFFMNKWLQSFAYRANLNWYIFIFSGTGALLIALFTVSFQAVKAARANPVDSLNYE